MTRTASLPDAEAEHGFKETLRQINRLRPRDRSKAIQALVECILANLTAEQVRAVRAELVEEFGADREFIVLLDGNLALREIRALPDE